MSVCHFPFSYSGAWPCVAWWLHFTDWVSQQKDVLAAVHMLGVLYSDQGKLGEAETMLL